MNLENTNIVANENTGQHARQHPVIASGPPQEPPEFLGTWTWRLPAPLERVEDWKARVARQCQALAGHTANWLRPGQPVQIHPDPRAGGGDMCGRIGTIHRLCSPVFADYVYVTFTPQGREKLPRTRLLTLESLTPIA